MGVLNIYADLIREVVPCDDASHPSIITKLEIIRKLSLASMPTPFNP